MISSGCDCAQHTTENKAMQMDLIGSMGIKSYHKSFEIYWMLGPFIVLCNFSSQLRNIMACITLASKVHFPVLVSREAIHPSKQELQ